MEFANLFSDDLRFRPEARAQLDLGQAGFNIHAPQFLPLIDANFFTQWTLFVGPVRLDGWVASVKRRDPKCGFKFVGVLTSRFNNDVQRLARCLYYYLSLGPTTYYAQVWGLDTKDLTAASLPKKFAAISQFVVDHQHLAVDEFVAALEFRPRIGTGDISRDSLAITLLVRATVLEYLARNVPVFPRQPCRVPFPPMDPPALPNIAIAEPAALPDGLQPAILVPLPTMDPLTEPPDGLLPAILVPFPTMDPLAEPPGGLLPAIPASPPVGSLESEFPFF